MRKLVLGLAAATILGLWAAFASGGLSLVVTHGNSMSPRITTGDLVVVRASSSYGVGDVVAYSSPELHQVVLHRIKAVQDGRYTFRGDHNDFDDPEHPTRGQLIGKELLHLPHGEVVRKRLTSPVALGILTAALLAGGGSTATARTRRRRKSAMSTHSSPSRSGGTRRVTGWSPRTRAVAASAIATTAAGLLLGVVAWTRPAAATGTGTGGPGSTMAFSYRADVPPSAAYDGTTVSSPEPVFRKLADKVDLRYTYRGDPGSVSVDAELSTDSGWHSTVPLGRPAPIARTPYTGHVVLDLDELDRRAQAAARVIGIPADQVEVAVVPSVTTTSGNLFAPRVPFALTPLQLTLVGGQAALTAGEPTSTARPAGPTRLHLGRYSISVRAARTGSAALTLAGLLALLVAAGTQLRTSGNEASAIRRRYADLLLHVEPVTSPAGRPVVDVAEFAALARLAERYGLLVMHWTRSNVVTYVVHDDGITYRYRTGTGPRHTSAAEESTPTQQLSSP